MDYELVPDPRTNVWSAKDDALVIYILAICPFVNIRQNENLLPEKTLQDIYSRFQVIMKNPRLQKRLLKEFPKIDLFDKYLPFSESDKYSLNRIIENNPNAIIETISAFPDLFNPIESPISTAKELLRIKKESETKNCHKKFAVNQYFDFLEKFVNNSKKNRRITKRRPKLTINRTERTFSELEDFVNSKFDRSDLAALVGFMSLHKIQKTRVIIGRESPFVKVDIDLTCYRMQTVSRNHCYISFCSDGKFYLSVLAREVLVNAELFYKGQNVQLKNHDIIDIGGIPLMLFENPSFRNQVDQLLENEN